ncbi:HhH-GPD superfamily base excision DNA repair protein [uncultured archaeon]|nr:HhH-GPD superfamily base excision DNA repair protein [uncultured archaeon]
MRKINSISTFRLKPVPPFRLDLTAWALRRRPDNIVDRWDDKTYRRVLVLNEPVEVAVTQEGAFDEPTLFISVTGASIGQDKEPKVSAVLNWLLGSGIDLSGFYSFAARDSRLGALAQRFRGLKPPRFPTIFEAVVNGIACQQLTLTVGIRLLNKLAQTYGAAINGAHAFPRPADLAGVKPEALRKLGFSRQKSMAIIELSASIAGGNLDPEDLPDLSDEEALSRLLELRGVGRWTAEYVLMRGAGRLYVFPGDDVGARNNLQRWLGIGEKLDYEGVKKALESWKPYGGIIYFHLLLDRLVEAGYFPEQ